MFWLMRRKESLEKREPERIRLWLLVLLDRARGDTWTAKSAVRSSSSIGAGGTGDVSSEVDPPALKSSTVGYFVLFDISESELNSCAGEVGRKGVRFQPVLSGHTFQPC